MVMVNQGHAPCMTSSSKNPHGSQLLWMPNSPKCWGGRHLSAMKGKVRPRILECASIACSMTGRPDGRFGVRVGTLHVGSLSGMGGEICEELRKRMIDVLFVGGEMERTGC